MNNFIFYFVLVTSIIDFCLLWYSHLHGADMTFQAAMAAYMMGLIIFVEIYDGRRK